MHLDPTSGRDFEQIVRTHQDAVFRTLLRLTGNREHVDDLAQEVFLRLFRALPAFRGDALLTTYLYRITVNVAQDEWKRRRRIDQPLTSISDEVAGWNDRLPHPAADAFQQIAHREFQEQVERELARLSPIEKTVLVLYHQEERTYEQIALVLGLPLGTVRTHLHRGRNKLRERLATADEPKRRKETPCPTT